MDIPEDLLNEIIKGKVILFLGSGASKGANDSKGNEPPLGNELSKLVYEKFIGSDYNNQQLSWVSEIAISESDLFSVQDYIREVFLDFEPANFHKLLPKFRWNALVTTNYDLIIEKAYEATKNPLQNVVPFKSTRDRIDDLMKKRDALLYIKLHGCITNTHDEKEPLILTTDQYIKYEYGRRRLFNTFEEYGYENRIVFIGHTMQDTDLRKILLQLSELGKARPRYYLVCPSIKEYEKRFFESKRISVLQGTFREFINKLDILLPENKRILHKDIQTNHPIESQFVINSTLSQESEDFLKNDADYVHSSIPIINYTPSKFYKGFNLGWYPIEQGLDVRRNLTDKILLDRILTNEEDRPTTVDFYIIKAEAGAGKSVFLKRLAWEAATNFEALCIFMKDHGQLFYAPIYEIYRLTNQRIFLFIDNASDNITAIEKTITRSRKDNLPLTIISAERINEWNMGCETLETFVNEEYKLPYLNREEIIALINLLEKHSCLGHLQQKTKEERIYEFEKKAGRQILVALHEATLGRPYEEILIDEYNDIRPQLAQSIYLSVCVLNRLNINVRAGLISRLYGIPFSEFDKKFSAPLEHVVQVSYDPIIKDYLYYSRHTYIAEIVFEKILNNKIDRYNEYIRIIKELNLSYSTDKKAFKLLIKGNTLNKLFPDFQDVKEIYKEAHKICSEDSYVYHQNGIYEMHRANPNYDVANKLLLKARKLDDNDQSIIHSLAELSRIRAEDTQNTLKRDFYRNESRKLAITLLNSRNNKNYAYHTLIKIYLDKLKELLAQENPNDRDIDKTIDIIENYIERYTQEFPDDEYLLVAESSFHEIMEHNDKALNALENAYRSNKRNPYIANRLAKTYESLGAIEKAINIIKETIEVNPGDQRMNFQYAMLLMNYNGTTQTIKYHLRRSFTKGDKNYESQFWYAVYCYLSNENTLIKESKEMFRSLREAAIPYSVKNKVRFTIKKEKIPKDFHGIVRKKEESYGFVERSGFGDHIFMHRDKINEKTWDILKKDAPIKFNIGFTYGGPIVIDVRQAE